MGWSKEEELIAQEISTVRCAVVVNLQSDYSMRGRLWSKTSPRCCLWSRVFLSVAFHSLVLFTRFMYTKIRFFLLRQCFYCKCETIAITDSIINENMRMARMLNAEEGMAFP